MKDLKKFNIPFAGLKEGGHSFEFEVENTFFEAFNYDEFNSTAITVNLNFVKKSTFFELTFLAKGFINVNCDISLEPYNQKIDATLPLLVKFGIEFNDDNEEILILPNNSYQINVAQYIYEMIILAVPTKRIHPHVIDGTIESEALKKLKELEITEVKTVENTDPRWDKLKNLTTEKKT
jgi:uncharacterized metal-binding protein YceD (DUF177 family)